MALTVTTLNGAITSGAQQVRLTAFTNPSSGGISAPTKVVIDGEVTYVGDATLSPVLNVSRGQEGTLGVSHNTLAPVVYGLTSDFAQGGGNGLAVAPVVTYSVDATYTNPMVDQLVYIAKAGVLALTLTDPAKDSTVTVRFISQTANAHVITYATGFYGNTTTSDTATFPSTAGGIFTMKAIAGVWYPVSTADDGVLIG